MSPVGRAAGYGDNPITPPRSSWKGGESSMCRAPVPWYLPSPADARSSSVDGGKKFPSPSYATGSGHGFTYTFQAVAPPLLCRRGALCLSSCAEL